MYGLIANLIAAPNRREELIAILAESTVAMPGCLSYIIARDMADENSIWVTEIWDSAESHDASLSLPAVQDAIARAKPIVAGFARTATTVPVAGVS